MSSEEDFIPDEEEDGDEGDVKSLASSDETNNEDDFIASDDDESEDDNGSYEPPEESDEESSTTPQQQQQQRPRRTRSATRQCSAKTNERMHQVLREEGMTEKEALRGMVQDVDVKYLHDTPSEDDSDDDNINATNVGRNKRKTRRSSSINPTKRKRHRRRIFDSEDEGESQNQSEDSDYDTHNNQYRTPNGRKARKVRRSLESQFDEEREKEWEDDADHNRAGKLPPTFFQAKYSHHSPTKLKIDCPSLKDERTKRDLPKGRQHVCCVSSDGVRHCYELDTLYRVAIEVYYSRAHARASDTIQFLQPPDFQLPMDADLLDQISSRFGRDKLDIKESSVYKDWMNSRDHTGDHGMGSKDLYCCPLCYSEAYRRQGNLIGDMAQDDESDSDSDGEDSGEEHEESLHDDPFLFRDDPMTILGNVGLVTASTFCFVLLSDVKEHMGTVHRVDPSVMKGNDLFKRFQIRAGDGLLQQWTKNPWAYWDGYDNSDRELFMDLLNRVEKAKNGNEKPDLHFSGSYPNRAKKLWVRLSEPYLKPQQDDDLNDMFDDNSVQQDLKPMPVVNDKEYNFEDNFAEHLRRKNKERGNNDPLDENDESSSSQYSSDDSESVSDETDEPKQAADPWTMRKMQKPTASRRRNRISSHDSDDDSLSEAPDFVSPKRKIIDSDDESSHVVSPHRKIIESDDES